MRVVIKLSGHLLSKPNNIINFDYINELIPVLQKIGEKHKTVVVTGGGEISRVYIDVLRKKGVNESLCDIIGIKISRLNSLLLSILLKDSAVRKIPERIEEVFELEIFNPNKIVAMGGLQPGQSTTTTAAIVSEAINADLLVIATNVDGIYTDDPRKNPYAEKIDEIDIEKLKRIFQETEVKAGTYHLLDYLAIRILERAKIQAIVLNGEPPVNILRAIKGEKIGTRILIR